MYHNIIVIGGGPSGIISAITLKDMGKDVAILEGNNRLGKKLLTTGNGRCNISNENINFNRYHSENKEFFSSVLENFNLNKTIDFFYSLGLPLITLEEGKMYPLSLQASSVLDILRIAIEEREINVYYNSKVKHLTKTKSGFTIETLDGSTFKCKKIILSTGGKSYASTGSDGSGYKLSEMLGHSIVAPVPALVQLKLDYKNLKALSGIKFDGYAEVIINGKSFKREFGEILFTDYGISGPPIIQLSRLASINLSLKNSVQISIDMMPHLSTEQLEDFFNNHFGVFSHRALHDSFIGIINKKAIPILLKEAGIKDIHKPCYQIEYKEKNKLFKLLKNWTFIVTDTNSFNNAQVTAGGVNTKEVHKESLESKICPNLYFAGEILDVDGDCGGFNLQWAWSSGYVAAINACK